MNINHRDKSEISTTISIRYCTENTTPVFRGTLVRELLADDKISVYRSSETKTLSSSRTRVGCHRDNPSGTYMSPDTNYSNQSLHLTRCLRTLRARRARRALVRANQSKPERGHQRCLNLAALQPRAQRA